VDNREAINRPSKAHGPPVVGDDTSHPAVHNTIFEAHRKYKVAR
jgi:hypothetical protein